MFGLKRYDVDSISYVSKDEALEAFYNAVGEERRKELELEGNPIPASLDITLEDSGNAQDVVDSIVAQSTFAKVVDSPENPMDSLRYSGQDTTNAMLVYEVIHPICITLIAILAPLTLVFVIALAIFRSLRRRREKESEIYSS